MRQPKRRNGCLGCFGALVGCLLIIPIFYGVISVLSPSRSGRVTSLINKSTESKDFWAKAKKDMGRESHHCKTQAELEEHWKQMHAMEVHSASYSFLNEPRFTSKSCLELQDPERIEDEARSHQRDVEQNNTNCPALTPPVDIAAEATERSETVPSNNASPAAFPVDSEPIVISQVPAQYTMQASAIHFSGIVILSATIDENGIPNRHPDCTVTALRAF